MEPEIIASGVTMGSAGMRVPGVSVIDLAGFGPPPGQVERAIVVHAGHMLDVRAGTLVQDRWITIFRGKIESIETARPEAGTFVELGDATLLPGLIDCHVHLSGSLEGDFVNRVVHESAVDDA
ncbi:MAG: hypothetical protein ABIP42_08210, partial [Planctomycetota bacterium]